MTKTTSELKEKITKYVSDLIKTAVAKRPSVRDMGKDLLKIMLDHKPVNPSRYNPKIKRSIGLDEDAAMNAIWPEVIKLNGKNIAYSTKVAEQRNLTGVDRVVDFIDFCLQK